MSDKGRRTNPGSTGANSLAVIARTSAMAYKGTRKTIAQIGRELRADYALERSVRCHRGRVRISAQLIRVRDQTHLWAQNFDRGLSDVLKVQSELGRVIADQVEVKLSAARHPVNRAVNPAALQSLSSRAAPALAADTPDIMSAIEFFGHTSDIDTGFAPAWAGLADSYNVLQVKSIARFVRATEQTLRPAVMAEEIKNGTREIGKW